MTPTRAAELGRALEHLEAARRLCRTALAFRVLAAVLKAIRVLELELSHGRPVQPRLELEATDAAPPAP